MGMGMGMGVALGARGVITVGEAISSNDGISHNLLITMGPVNTSYRISHIIH